LDYIKSELANASEGAVSMIEALALTVSIEQSLIERKFFEAFRADSSELKQLLLNLDSATRTHMRQAQDALEKYRPSDKEL
jgi:hypothetical protein